MNNGTFDIMGKQYASVTVANVTLYDLVCNAPAIRFTTLKMSNLEGTAEATDITGGQGNATLASINHTRALTVSMEDALMTMSYLAVITGGEIVHSGANSAIKVVYNETLSPLEDAGTPGEFNLEFTHTIPVGTTVWVADYRTDGTISEKKSRFDVAGTATQSIAIDDAAWKGAALEEDGTYHVFYEYEITDLNAAQELTVFADKFSKTYRFVGDTVLYNVATGQNEAFQIEIPRLKLDDNYSMTFDAAGESAVFGLNGKALRDAQNRLVIFRLMTGDAGSTDEQCLVI